MDPVTKAMLTKYNAVRVDSYVKVCGKESERHHRISVFETAGGVQFLVMEGDGEPIMYQAHDKNLIGKVR